ncbi:hypothetical protein FQ377_08305 [Arthrobacter echini]|uniref:Glycoside hydrolase family 42 N-terminal domain-containing protein n=1 Tax=Arthrobacter echini TaxID=1529066 RepID=A0A5D0XT57_9MICC|nr:hypothetical protein [Arthrobacter echini]TYC98992.1 hypothetical protein FQ377_08305 [Arthrobacter echini]
MAELQSGSRAARRRLAVASVLVAGLVIVGTTTLVMRQGVEENAATGGDVQYGVLASQCDPLRSRQLTQAGVDVAHVDLRWDLYHPESDAADPTYTQQVFSMLEVCRDAGLDVIVGLGTQYAPEWVRELPDGRFVDQTGTPSEADAPNLMYSSDVRGAFERYTSEVIQLLPEGSVSAIRLGTSEAGELGFPAEALDSRSGRNSFWAYNDAAQTGDGLPEGMTPSPLPGWEPGTDEWSGGSVTEDDVDAWFSWYSDSVVRTVAWQITLLRDLGFEGEFHLPFAGRGTLPADREAAVAALLDGTADRDASLERGLYYPTQLHAIREATPDAVVVADITGLGDATAVRAREASPRADTCEDSDVDLSLEDTPEVADWSASRWTIALAREAGYPVMGENPGPPSNPGTGSDSDSDSLPEQLRFATQYAEDCKLRTFLFAFEDNLFETGTAVPLSLYAHTIRDQEGRQS